MDYELIITEKPNAAKKIAEALADGKPVKKVENKVAYYDITHNGKDILVGCAVGHLYGVAEKNKGKWSYPIFDTEWVPSAQVNKGAAFTTKYLNVLKKLGKQAKTFTVATDYDIEGEVIGYNVLKHACKQNDANRMKYSTLTTDELIESYEKKQKTLDWGQLKAGLTRHEMDWLYGINLSRALTLSIKKATNQFKLLSSGRVQGPSLKILVDKENEIAAFVAKPYWELHLFTKPENTELDALHIEDKFWEKHNCIIMSSQGQTTRGIRRLLQRLSQEYSLPIYVLCDGDIWGAYIYSVLKYGSINLAHMSENMTIKTAKFLGVTMDDIEKYGLKKHLITLTENDYKRIDQLQNYEWFKDNKEWQRQFKLMKTLKGKVEIQSLSSRSITFISEKYLPEKIKNQDWIN